MTLPQSRSFRALAVLFLLSLPLVNPYLRGDGNGYYAYVRSAIIDGDLSFENEFQRSDPLFHGWFFDDSGALRPSMRSPTGLAVNQWAVGPSLLWLPFFLTAHGLVLLAQLFGSHVAADGFSAPYRWLCGLGTALYGWLALVMAWQVAERTTTRPAAIVATVAIWGASSLAVYMYFLPFHVHAMAAFAVSLFLWLWLRWRPFGERAATWFAWGLAGGLMIDVYYLNALLLSAAAAEYASAGPGTSIVGRARLTAGAAFAGGLALALVPHVLVKWIVYGTPVVTGYLDQFFWTTPRLWQVGFSVEHGLFLWTPVVLAAVVGFVMWARRYPLVGVTLAATLVVFYYVIAAYQDWHGLSSFGNRFFISFTFVFVLGLAALIEWVTSRWPARRRAAWAVVSAALALAVAWNVGFMFQWGTDIVPNRGPVSFRQVARNQVTVVPERISRFLWRYLTDRAGLTKDVERQDREEQQKYDMKR